MLGSFLGKISLEKQQGKRDAGEEKNESALFPLKSLVSTVPSVLFEGFETRPDQFGEGPNGGKR